MTGIEGAQGRDRFAVGGSLLSRQQVGGEDVPAAEGDVLFKPEGRADEARPQVLHLFKVLGCETKGAVEVGYLRAPAIAQAVGADGGVELEERDVGRRAQRIGTHRLLFLAGAPGNTDLQAAHDGQEPLVVQRPHDHAAGEVLQVVRVAVAVDFTVGDGQGVIEAVTQELLPVHHHPHVTLRDQLVDERALERGNKAVLDQLLIAERLLEFARLDLEGIPVVHVQVRILDARLAQAEVG